MENTSRSVALELLAEILDGEIELEPIAHLGKIRKNVWADSELESRFPSAIQSLSQHEALGSPIERIALFIEELQPLDLHKTRAEPEVDAGRIVVGIQRDRG